MTEYERVRARYRARKSYLIKKKGLSVDEAENQAKSIIQDLGRLRVPMKSNKILNFPQGKTAKSTKPIQAKFLEPTKLEVDDVVEELKQRGQILKNPQVVNQTNQNTRPLCRKVCLSSAKSSAEKEQKAESPVRQAAGFLPMAGYLLVVCAASAVLIAASLEVFGYEWQGWLKACLLEAGILLFAVSKAPGAGEWLIKRLSAAFLIGLSFFVLHTSVETDRQKQLAIVTTDDVSLQNLKERRQRLLANHDNLPASHATRRSEILRYLEQVDSEISAKLQVLKASAPVQVVELVSSAEMLMRIAILLISIVFSHAFAREIRLIFQGREGLQGS